MAGGKKEYPEFQEMNIRILASARDTLIEGAQFYEGQKEGLGEYFVDTLLSDIDSLVFLAGIHPVFYQRFFRMLSRRFPYAVYYKINGETVEIFAILDCRQNPDSIKKRLTV